MVSVLLLENSQSQSHEQHTISIASDTHVNIINQSNLSLSQFDCFHVFLQARVGILFFVNDHDIVGYHEHNIPRTCPHC